MEAAGCKLLANPVKRSAMLAGAVFTQSFKWWKLLRLIRRHLSGSADVAGRKPDVVIPIDSSFINLRIAAAAKEEGLKVCYYVAPQLWASRPGRIAKIKASVDTLCCVLPFEEKYFGERGVRAIYVGHPMFDVPVGSGGETNLPRTPGAGPNIAIFPGSRKAEIKGHMPAMLTVLQQIKGKHPRARFVAAAPSEERAWQIRHHLRAGNLPVEIKVGDGDAVIGWADLVLCKSGTTTLQVARQAKPMVVIFAVARWQWVIARHLIHTKYFALVNILVDREVVKEFVPYFGRPGLVAKACLDLLNFPDLRARQEEDLRAVTAPLMPREGVLASDRVADEVTKLL
jgi:lipid-A-disaccharide synthase